MHIHQLSASYEAAQDRILLRINTHEGQVLQLWFTRRLLRQLFPKLLEYERSMALRDLAQDSPEKTSGHSAEAQEELLAEKEPSLQFTTPEELGELAVFFCSPAGNNVRGVAWQMDGAWTAQ